MASTLGVTGVVTANAGVVVDNITIDGTEIDLSSGNLTLDVAGSIVLNADGGQLQFHDGSTEIGVFENSSTNFVMESKVQDKDIIFKGNDGGSGVTALTLDMSDGGNATFAGNITQSKAGNLRLTQTATGSGEASLHLHANNTSGDSFIRWQTLKDDGNSTTFAMGIDNSDGDKFILSAGSDTHSDSVINIQPDGSSIAVDKPISFGGVVQLLDVAQSIDFIQSGAINFDSNGDQTGRVLTIGTNRTGDSGGTSIATFTDTGKLGVGTTFGENIASSVNKFAVRSDTGSTHYNMMNIWEHDNTTAGIEQRIGWAFGDDGGNEASFGLAGYIGVGKQDAWSTDGVRDSYMTFGTADGNSLAEQIRITANGDVGINDTAPGTALTSFGSASRGLSIKNGQPTIALTDTDTGSGALYIANGGGISYFQNTVSGSTMRFYVESIQALEIENDGVLKSSDGIEFTGSALGGSQTGVSSSGSGGDLLLFTNGSAFARLLSTGRLVASGNTSSTSAINTAHTFYIDQADTAFAIDNESSGNAFGLQIRYSATGHGTSGYFISCYANPSGSLQARFIVAEDGDVTNSNNSYGSISDQRVKKDITDANSQWDDIKALKIRNYKKDEAGDGSVQIGVVAQELEEAGMNGLVDEAEATDIDVENFPNINEGDKIKSVKYSVLYMKSIKALQEAMAKIETLETKVEALENA